MIMIDFEEALDRISNDLELRVTLQAARAWAVSPRRFLGLWEPAYVTVYTRDDVGNVIMSETRFETPEWTKEDRILALALDQYERQLCQGCGKALTETTKPEHYGAYRAGLPQRCHACTAIYEASERYEETAHPEALKFSADLVPDLIVDLSDWEYESNHEDHLPTG